jgi:A/G-specific adenine glycosylase
MLQQTQVATVIPYWHRWLDRFPTPEALAVADEQEVLSLWQGLGYYRRCRLLLEGARFVVREGMPRTAKGLRQVPGIGAYTAGAVASIAFGEPAPLVDGNVERVFARLTGDDSVGLALHKRAWAWAEEQLFADRPGDWNQALMELGATVCTPVDPNCESCPLKEPCVARAKGITDLLPTKETKPKPVRLEHVVIVPTFEGRLGLRQIPAGQWWAGMWEFPRAERGEEAEILALVGDGWQESLGAVSHSVTNHRITIHVSRVRCEKPSPDLSWFDADSLAKLPLPAPQRRIAKMVAMA